MFLLFTIQVLMRDCRGRVRRLGYTFGASRVTCDLSASWSQTRLPHSGTPASPARFAKNGPRTRRDSTLPPLPRVLQSAQLSLCGGGFHGPIVHACRSLEKPRRPTVPIPVSSGRML